MVTNPSQRNRTNPTSKRDTHLVEVLSFLNLDVSSLEGTKTCPDTASCHLERKTGPREEPGAYREAEDRDHGCLSQH